MLDLLTAERVADGVQRLLTAPLDLRRCGVLPCPTGRNGTGTREHRLLFEEYVGVLEVVARAAFDWWAETVEARRRLLQDEDRAVREAWRSRPAGPGAFPGVVAVVRDYWLACDELNRQVPEERRVSPEMFLLGWLSDQMHTDRIRVLSCLPYWPIGLDREGNWI